MSHCSNVPVYITAWVSPLYIGMHVLYIMHMYIIVLLYIYIYYKYYFIVCS